jgi:hypothetical protein
MIAAAALGALVLVGATAVITATLVSDDDEPAAVETSAPTESPSSANPLETLEETETYNEDPSADDFELTLKNTHKKCFGTAGCNLTVLPQLGYGNPFLPDPDVTISITYEIKGPEDGPVIETIEATRSGDDLNYSTSEVDFSVPSSSTKVTAEITDVMTY